MVFSGFNEFGVSFVGHTAVRNYISVKLTALLYSALLCFVIYVNQAKTSRLALSPFKIIYEAPMIIALDTVVCFADKLQLVIDES